MKIEHKAATMPSVADLAPGDIFEAPAGTLIGAHGHTLGETAICMKLVGNHDYNAVDLAGGALMFFFNDTRITPLPTAKLVLP